MKVTQKDDCDNKFCLHFRIRVYSPKETQYVTPISDLMERKAIM